jgi:hypothetical protein
MEKIVIDLTNNQLTEALYTSFAYNIQKMLTGLGLAGFDVPATIRGTQKQIDSFFRALKGEKRYMDAYAKYGLGDTRTMMNKRDLDRAVGGFERETGLRWPFKN